MRKAIGYEYRCSDCGALVMVTVDCEILNGKQVGARCQGCKASSLTQYPIYQESAKIQADSLPVNA